MPSVRVTEALVRALFEDLEPGFDHMRRVADEVAPYGEIYEQVALLHDTLEDTDATREELASLGYPAEVLDAVEILTRRPKEPYQEYIDRVCASENHIAIVVKLADNHDNSDPHRHLLFNQFKSNNLMKRYNAARPKLEGALREARNTG